MIRYGTIFECDGIIAVRHRVQEQENQTLCGKGLVFEGTPDFQTDHELSKEIRCRKCYPNHK